MSKYRNVRTTVDDTTWGARTFSSQKEAIRYRNLLWAQAAGECLWFLCQIPFYLPGNIKYVADFLVVWKDGRVTVEDVKGFKTATYRLKKKLVEQFYPIRIVEI